MTIKNRLIETHPEIASEWHPLKNGALRANDYRATAKDLIWWRCDQGHEYQASIYSRVRSGGCKVCHRAKHVEASRLTKLAKSKSFAEASPLLVAQWDTERNGDLRPDNVSFKSKKMIWWKCNEGHSWQSTPGRRTRGDGCPECYKQNQGDMIRRSRAKRGRGTLASVYPSIAAEWDYELNSYKPSEIAPKSGLKAHWRCKLGHRWQATVTNRTHNKSGCPDCNPQTSRVEIYILCELREIFSDVDWRKKFDGVECDIYVDQYSLGIEVDGAYWHKDKLTKDQTKTAFLEARGIQLIRLRQEGLPQIAGHVIEYYSNEDLQLAAQRLAIKIRDLTGSEACETYLKSGRQKGAVSFNAMVARLPAPPEGETLDDVHPELTQEWDYEANDPLTPDLFSPGSDQKMAWVCSAGHKWQATIKNRTIRKSSCPECSRMDQSARVTRSRALRTDVLADGDPLILKMYDSERNPILPSEIATKSSVTCYWKCEAGHSFEQKPVNMMHNSKCPACKSLPVAHPELMKEWDFERNVDLDPADFGSGSGRKVWWKCANGHFWKVGINQRTTAGHGCRKCYHERQGADLMRAAAASGVSLQDLAPDYLAEWDYELNEFSPAEVTPKSSVKVWWRCPNHCAYQQTPIAKYQGSICPECSKTKRAETVRLAKLAKRGSLKDRFPGVAAEWHPNRNGDLTPDQLTAGSKMKVWWKCSQGHEWEVSPNVRTGKLPPSGCPSCRKERGRRVRSES